MRRFNWRKYAVAVYLLILAVAAILALVGLNYFGEGSSAQGLLLNLSTELAGAVLIFIVVNLVFSLNGEGKKNSDSVSEQLGSLQARIDARFNSLIPRSQLKSRFDFVELLPDATKVMLLGYTHSGLFRLYKREIAKAIDSGVKFQVLLLDVHADAGKLIEAHARNYTRFVRYHNSSLEIIKELSERARLQKQASLELRLTTWIPSCELIIVMTQPEQPDLARIRIQPIFFREGDDTPSRILVLSSGEDPDDFNYFLHQFEALWQNDSKPTPS